MGLTPRQQREIDFHRNHAEKMAGARVVPVNFDVIEDMKRRPANAFWSAYDRVLAHDWKGRRVLVPGCGFGEDAIRMARLGASVDAFDISPDVIEIARRRCAEFGYAGVNFGVMPCESIAFPDAGFDLVFFVDILHHVDIGKTLAEIARVLKPGGRIIGDELYTHSAVQRNIRKSWFVDKALYAPMKKFIYGDEKPYITDDERKIDENEIRLCENACSEFYADWFNMVVGRLAPDRWPLVCELDRAAMKIAGGAGRLLAGRVVFEGVIRKD